MSVPTDVLVEDVSTESRQCEKYINERGLRNDRTIKSFHLLFRSLLCAHSFHLGLPPFLSHPSIHRLRLWRTQKKRSLSSVSPLALILVHVIVAHTTTNMMVYETAFPPGRLLFCSPRLQLPAVSCTFHTIMQTLYHWQAHASLCYSSVLVRCTGSFNQRGAVRVLAIRGSSCRWLKRFYVSDNVVSLVIVQICHSFI
jgi:hypothetical protein